MSSPPVVWAIIHDLGRSGVPVALERMLRWQAIARPDAAAIHVVAHRDGPLRASIAPWAASVTTLEPAQGRSAASTLALAATQLRGRPTGGRAQARWIRHQVRHLPAPDAVLVQGAGAWPTFSALEPVVAGARLVVHLHELEAAIGRSGLGTDAGRMVQQPALLLAVGDAVAQAARDLGAGADRVAVVSGSADDPPGGWDQPIVPATAPTLVSVGAAGWRKGTDRATAAAHELHRVRPGATWHWVGEPEPSAWALAVGSPDPLQRHPEVSDPWSVVATPAALVIPSREDPLPLVALEAGARGIPVVAARTGGLTDLLAHGRGLSVDGTDLRALVAAAASCLDDPGAAAERAHELRLHIRAEHATSVVGPRWLDGVLGHR